MLWHSPVWSSKQARRQANPSFGKLVQMGWHSLELVPNNENIYMQIRVHSVSMEHSTHAASVPKPRRPNQRMHTNVWAGGRVNEIICKWPDVATICIMSLSFWLARGDWFLSASQRGDKHCRPPFRVSFSSLILTILSRYKCLHELIIIINTC
jgi:hypothetical protein